ncbi:MAG: glycosyltransferase family 4 protein [Chloroflexi bacterium]|nr:glycosyltransferase family 4 protein [Chloroflexota bacterium]
MTRIAINGSFWNQPNTGSGQYMRALLPALVQRDIENEYTLIAPTALDNVPICVSARQTPIALNRVSANLGKVWFEQIAFARACIRERATRAHVPYFAPPFFSRTPVIVTIHDLIPMLLPAYCGSLLVRVYTQLVAASARRARAIIADSECSKRDIIRVLRVPEARVRVVYLATHERFVPVNDSNIRAKYNLPENFLFYLGGYDQRKNVRVMIEAFAQLPEFYRAGVRLILAGVNLGQDSEFFPDPRRIARESNLPDDAIQSIGWVDEADKPALYSSARTFLFPSLYEGFGLPPLEAMASGAPVIASNASSLPEVIGDAGMLIAPRDARAWADAMRAVLTDDARRDMMRTRGLIQAKKFSWQENDCGAGFPARIGGLKSRTTIGDVK